jgi:hypothetical protein
LDPALNQEKKFETAPSTVPLNGYVDRTKSSVFRPRFDMSMGLAKVMVNGTDAYIDTAGHYIWIPTP